MSQPKKKMNLVQLTFIVAVNMMGSGIIMLPTNMAKVGAISLLSWIVTAVIKPSIGTVPEWLETTRAPPTAGMFSIPRTSIRNHF